MCVCSEESPPQIADHSFNLSRYEYAFDIGADIEPIPTTEDYAIDYDNFDCDSGNDFDDLTQGMNKSQLLGAKKSKEHDHIRRIEE